MKNIEKEFKKELDVLLESFIECYNDDDEIWVKEIRASRDMKRIKKFMKETIKGVFEEIDESTVNTLDLVGNEIKKIDIEHIKKIAKDKYNIKL